MTAKQKSGGSPMAVKTWGGEITTRYGYVLSLQQYTPDQTKSEYMYPPCQIDCKDRFGSIWHLNKLYM